MKILRLGGGAATGLLLLCANLTFGSTLNYFYGYSTPDFGTASSTDALAGQNLSTVPTASMITLQSADQTASFGSTSASVFTQSARTTQTAVARPGYSAMIQAYGYSMPSSQLLNSDSSLTSATASSALSSYAVPTAIPSASTVSPSSSIPGAASSGSGLDSSLIVMPTASTSGGSSNLASSSLLAATGTTSAFSNGGLTTTSTLTSSPFAGISFITTRYDTVVTPTVTTTSSVLSTNTASLLGAGGTPEPASFGVAGAALALIALKLRRK